MLTLKVEVCIEGGDKRMRKPIKSILLRIAKSLSPLMKEF